MSEREEKGTPEELQGKNHSAAAPYLCRPAETERERETIDDR